MSRVSRCGCGQVLSSCGCHPAYKKALTHVPCIRLHHPIASLPFYRLGPVLRLSNNNSLSWTGAMYLTYSFVLLLGSLFAMTLDTHAVPLTREQTGVVTLPLKRIPLRRDLHPQMVSTALRGKKDRLIFTHKQNSSSKCMVPVHRGASPG
jgi:hypothetical protein